MNFIADLHIHSRFSRATSKLLSARHLAAWGKCKGIDVIGTGDFTHPQWRAELREQLEPYGDSGLYRLKVPAEELDFLEGGQVRPHDRSDEPLFCLQTEISSIYKRGGKVRKVHNLIYVPTLDDADNLSARLARIGNLNADGRPILGLDSRDLLEILLETVPDGVFIPAHIWTPWFALFGSKSGFDRLEDCFADLSDHIFALETGLSSDPAMNRCVSALDKYCLISNSDAHSGANLGREANLFAGRPSFQGMFNALRTAARREPQDALECRFLGTMEFYPEEGKYHLDGHRACNVMLEPRESEALGNICPVCGKPLTVGVLHRVLDLADRQSPAELPQEPQARPLIPLPEVIGEILGVGAASRKVSARFSKILRQLGPELDILCHMPEDSVRAYWEPLGEAVARMRRGQVFRQGGYDGEYGVVRVFSPQELSDVRQHSASLPGLSTGKQRGRPRKQSAEASLRLPVSATEVSSASNMETTTAATDRRDSTAYPHPATSDSPASVENPSPHGPASQPAAAQTGCTSVSPRHDFSALPLLQAGLAAKQAHLAKPVPATACVSPATSSAAAPAPLAYSSEQRTALQADACPTLVLAGPGAGKTRVLVGRLQWLLEQGTLPQDVLALTFTKRAAAEIKQRLAQGTASAQGQQVLCDTLHGLAWDLLRRSAPSCQLLPEDSAKALFREANPQLDARQARELWDICALSRETLCPLPEGSAAALALSRYTARKKMHPEHTSVDYSDLLEWLLASAAQWRGHWRHILVDEVQDLSPVQLALLQALLPADGQGFFGIGDPDQAIYGFRGASGQSEASFRALWPHLQVCKLGTSYRASAAVLHMAQELLQGQGQCGRLNAARQMQADLRLFTAPDDKAEARWIARHIQSLLGATSHTLLDQQNRNAPATPLQGALSPADIAVLVRIKAQIPVIAAALEAAGIPYAAPAQEQFWQHAPCATLLAAVAHHDSTVDQDSLLLPSLAQDTGSALAEVLPWQGTLPGPQAMVNWLQSRPWGGSALLNSGAWRALCQQWQECGSWQAFFARLVWLQEAELISAKAEQVQVLTMHASKGLEFRAVFLPGLEQGLLPLQRSRLNGAAAEPSDADSAAQLMEERRLLYVALTRASEALYVSRCARRSLFGRSLELPASCFLSQVAGLCRQTVLTGHSRKKEEQLSLGL